MRNVLPSISSVPVGLIEYLSGGCSALITVPSLSQRIFGCSPSGLEALQCRVTMLWRGSVWFAGPICIIGGGRSATDVTWNTKKLIPKSAVCLCKLTWRKALTLVDPATLRAEQTRNPASSRCTPWILSVPWEFTCMWPYDVSGNINSWEPSLFQNTEGGGLPVAAQWNSTTPLSPTFWSFGVSIKVGGAARKCLRFSRLSRLLKKCRHSRKS